MAVLKNYSSSHSKTTKDYRVEPYRLNNNYIDIWAFDRSDGINKRFKVTTEGGDPINPVTGHLYILGEAAGNTWAPNVGVEMSTNDGYIFTTQVTFNGEHSEEDANVSYFSFTTSWPKRVPTGTASRATASPPSPMRARTSG